MANRYNATTFGYATNAQGVPDLVTRPEGYLNDGNLPGVGVNPQITFVNHPIFGVIPTSADRTAINLSEPALGLANRDKVYRETGIAKQLTKNNRIIAGLTAPGAYLNSKNADLARIGAELAGEYDVRFNKLIAQGYTREEADKKALAYVREIQKFQMEEHEREFPENLTKETTERLKRKNEAGALGV